MPDENKFQKLREIGYHIPVTCGMCVHVEAPDQGVDPKWGECKKHRYHHRKHDNPDEGRGVSVLGYGTCDDAELDPRQAARFGAHAEFLVTAKSG